MCGSVCVSNFFSSSRYFHISAVLIKSTKPVELLHFDSLFMALGWFPSTSTLFLYAFRKSCSRGMGAVIITFVWQIFWERFEESDPKNLNLVNNCKVRKTACSQNVYVELKWAYDIYELKCLKFGAAVIQSLFVFHFWTHVHCSGSVQMITSIFSISHKFLCK